MIEIGIEPLVQPEARVENRRADERRRGVAVVMQDLGERDGAGRQLVADEIVHARRHGESAGQERGVGGKGDGDGRISVCESSPRPRQGVNGGRLCRLVSVASHVVGAQRVNGYQDNVRRIGVRRGPRLHFRGEKQSPCQPRRQETSPDE